MNKKALSTMMAVFLVLAIGAVGYVIRTSSGVTGYAVKAANIDTSNLCRYGEKQCGFGAGEMPVTNEKYTVCDDISGNDYNGKTGYQVCEEQEVFKKCAFIERNRNNLYFASTDKSCSGGRQFEDMDVYSLPCTELVGAYTMGSCNVINYNNAIEPLYGDYSTEKTSHVYCCK